MKTSGVLALAGGVLLSLSSLPVARASGVAQSPQQATRRPAPQALSPSAASAEARTGRTVYVLGAGAELGQGCFEACACPISLASAFRGTFVLRPTVSPDAAFRTFAVEDVRWIATLGGEELHLRGDGTYRVGSAGGRTVQRLVLSLALDGAPPTLFDSGLVPGGDPGPRPAITVFVDEPDNVCYETAMTVDAAPATGVVRYAVGPGSTRTLGCLPPCACPILLQVLRGSFDAVAIASDGTTLELALLDVDLGVGAFVDVEPPPTTPIASGSGLYRLWIDGSGLAELELDLDVVDAGPQHFESGLVPAAAFPAIEIAVADNGFVCFNEVYSLVAAPAP